MARPRKGPRDNLESQTAIMYCRRSTGTTKPTCFESMPSHQRFLFDKFPCGEVKGEIENGKLVGWWRFQVEFSTIWKSEFIDVRILNPCSLRCRLAKDLLSPSTSERRSILARAGLHILAFVASWIENSGCY